MLSTLGLDSLGVTLGGAEATLEAAEEPPEATEGALGLSPPPVGSATPSSDISLQKRPPIHDSFCLKKKAKTGLNFLKAVFVPHT